MQQAYIYKVQNKLNGKIYIGQHDGSKPAYFASGTAIKKAIRKYGKQSFTREILISGTFSKAELDELEIFYIAQFQSYAFDHPDKGYNLTKGGMGKCGAIQSEDAKRRQRLNCANRRSVVQLTTDGKYVATYFSGVAAAKSIGAQSSSIVRCCQGVEITASGFRWAYEDDYATGVHPTGTAKDCRKAVAQLDESGNQVSLYESAGSAAKALGISRAAIANVLCGNRKRAAGYRWALI